MRVRNWGAWWHEPKPGGKEQPLQSWSFRASQGEKNHPHGFAPLLIYFYIRWMTVRRGGVVC